jgi:hypothetical protein
MAKFIEGTSLNNEINRVFREAEEELVLISPYIKLHHRYKKELEGKIENPKLAITVVFGKNEGDLSKSLNLNDLEFFIGFPNVKICYEPRLHAKYYSNEYSAVLTSMNLYDFSQDQNIEAGVLIESSLLGMVRATTLDEDSDEYFKKVANQSEVIFEKVPQYESKFGGLQKKYVSSEIKVNKLEEHFKIRLKEEVKESPQPVAKQPAPAPEPKVKQPTGYCIRTGVTIPFNPERPMSYEAYKTWAQYEDDRYPERYCHFSGESSNGDTSFAKPILRKNWKAAKAMFVF